MSARFKLQLRAHAQRWGPKWGSVTRGAGRATTLADVASTSHDHALTAETMRDSRDKHPGTTAARSVR